MTGQHGGQGPRKRAARDAGDAVIPAAVGFGGGGADNHMLWDLKGLLR